MITFLKNYGLLGINARNHLYIRPFNPKKAIILANDKIKTKHFLEARNIPVPKFFKIINNHEELDKFDLNKLPQSFVIKPNQGSRGGGIIPIVSHKNGIFKTVDQIKISKDKLESALADILDGAYSITGERDKVLIEQRVVCNTEIMEYCDMGLPDIRVIVHNLIPVMAMLRIPTKESGGKANMHLGAYGIGVDIANGKCTNTAQGYKLLKEIKGKKEIRGFQIPYWDEILNICSKIQYITNIGFLAVDIVIDKNIGPMVLELNARAGVKLQIPNLIPLKKRLDKIQDIKVTKPEKGVRIAKEVFGNIIEKKVESIYGKQIITNPTPGKLILKDHNKQININIDCNTQTSYINEDFAKENNLVIQNDKVLVKLIIKDKRIQTVLNISKKLNHNIVLGNRDLSNFLIDPCNLKKKVVSINFNSKKITNNDLSFIDEQIYEIKKKYSLVSYLRPLNMSTEKKKYLANNNYIPQFKYKEINKEYKNHIRYLEQLKINKEDHIGILFNKTRDQLVNKIKLIASLNNDKLFLELANKYFGGIDDKLLGQAKEIINTEQRQVFTDKNIDEKEVHKIISKQLDYYSLNEWKISYNPKILTRFVIGKNNTLIINPNKKFTKGVLNKNIVHEIKTHIFTKENGKNQQYKLFSSGFSDYLVTQEGLAIYNQVHFANCNLYKPAVYILAIKLSQTNNFNELVEEIMKLNYSRLNSFLIACRVKRGLSDLNIKGAISKEKIYLEGYYQIGEYLNSGGDMKDLYYGKYNIDDLSTILKYFKLKEPKYLPKWVN